MNQQIAKQCNDSELAVTKVRHKLYVHVEERDGFRDLLPIIYLNAASIRPEIDLRVLVDRRTIHEVDRIVDDEVYFSLLKQLPFC